jgi:hypothetical protein
MNIDFELLEIENYPVEVADHLRASIMALNEERFFEDNEIEKNGVRSYITVAGPVYMSRWVNGTLDEALDDEEEITTVLKQTIILSVMFDVKDKGMVDLLEDEDGEPFFFMTQAGKDYLERTKES